MTIHNKLPMQHLSKQSNSIDASNQNTACSSCCLINLILIVNHDEIIDDEINRIKNRGALILLSILPIASSSLSYQANQLAHFTSNRRFRKELAAVRRFDANLQLQQQQTSLNWLQQNCKQSITKIFQLFQITNSSQLIAYNSNLIEFNFNLALVVAVVVVKTKSKLDAAFFR